MDFLSEFLLEKKAHVFIQDEHSDSISVISLSTAHHTLFLTDGYSFCPSPLEELDRSIPLTAKRKNHVAGIISVFCRTQYSLTVIKH